MQCFQAVFLVLATAIATTAGQCTFPAGVQGTWLTNTKGTITVSSTELSNFPIASLGGTYSLECLAEYNGRYITRSTTSISVGGLTLYVYMCFDFTSVSTNLYYYQLASPMTSGERAMFRGVLNAPTEAEVCSVSTTDYDPTELQVMVKDGDGAAAMDKCPTDLSTDSWSYEIDSGSGNTCGTNTEMNFCTEGQISLNYTACNTPVFYSAAGEVFCLTSVTTVNGSVTYLTVYNNDTTVDGSTTYRFACLAFEKSGNDVYMTQYPLQCHTGQASNYVLTSGSTLHLLNSNITTETTSLVLYIVLGVIGGLVLITLIGTLCFCWCTWKAKQKPFRGRLEPEKHDPTQPRLQSFENGFKRHRGPQQQQSVSGNVTPDNDDDTPINVMQLLRKDIITPGGRDSPASHVLLSVTTPNPYSLHDADSIGGNSIPVENPALKKHYHVIGGEPSMGGDEEFNTPRGSGRQGKTPVMVMPVRPSANSLNPDDDDDDDYDNDDDNYNDIHDPDLVAARKAVGLNEAMCPPTRLPPIDEGPASHRSYTGAGNPGKRTTSFGQSATIVEESPREAEDTPREEHPRDIPRPSSRCETPDTGRRSSLGLLYKMEGNIMIAIPDITETVDCEIGAVDEGDKEKKVEASVKKGAKLRASPRVGRRGSLTGARSADLKKRMAAAVVRPNRPKSTKPKVEVSLVDEEEMRPNSQVKMTGVNIPDLLPLGETPRTSPRDHELLDSPGRYNPAFTMGTEGSMDDNPRKLWLNPVRPTEDVWGRVSNLWRRLGQAWPDKPT